MTVTTPGRLYRNFRARIRLTIRRDSDDKGGLRWAEAEARAFLDTDAES